MLSSTVNLIPHLRQLFAVGLIILLPLSDLRSMQRLQRYTSSAGRLSAYRSLLPWLWIPTAIAVVMSLPGNILVVPHGDHESPWLLGVDAIRIGLTVMLGLLLLLPVAQSFYLGLTVQRRAKYAKAVSRFRYFLPVTAYERYWWIVVCVTAGLCEEVIFRGYLMQFFAGKIAGGTQLGLIAGLLISSAAFGFAHLYQGVRGIIATTAGGMLFGLLAILTGNLILPMLAHTLLDAAPLWVYRPEQDKPAEAARLIQGYDLVNQSLEQSAF